MRWSILLLICASITFAQEIESYSIPTSAQPSFVFAAGTGGNLVELFYNVSGDVFHLTFDREQQSVVSPPVSLDVDHTTMIYVQTAEVLPNGEWVCVLRECLNCPDYPRTHHAWAVRGFGSQILESVLFFDVNETDEPYEPRAELSESRIAVGADNSFYVTGVMSGRWGFEGAAELILYPQIPYYENAQDQYLVACPQSIENDTLEILSVGALTGTLMNRIPVNCESSCVTRTQFWHVGGDAGIIFSTRGGTKLLVNNDHVTKLNADGTFETLVTLDERVWKNSRNSDYHPDLGFAYLRAEENALLLTRVDTLGQLSATTGTVAWNPTQNSASLNFASNGQIFVAYALNDSELGLTIVPWYAPLNSPDRDPLLPQDISLKTYPNPFNSTVRIDYDLSQTTDVTLTVYNTLGQQVATLFDGNAQAGSHSATWSPEVASGVYLVSLQTSTSKTSSKILFIR